MKKIGLTFLGAVSLILLTAAGFLSGLQLVFLNPEYYTELMDTLDVYEDVGISREEQALINGDLADYLAGRKDSLERTVTLNGVSVSCAFNNRELRHMADVAALFRKGVLVRNVAAAAGAALLILCLLTGARKYGAEIALLALAVVSLCVGALITLLLRADFNTLFLRFHALIFDNTLWLLNPETDALIRMLPEAFFERIAARGLLFGALLSAGVFLVGSLTLLLRRREK